MSERPDPDQPAVEVADLRVTLGGARILDGVD